MAFSAEIERLFLAKTRIESVLTPKWEKVMLAHTIKRLGAADDIAGVVLCFGSRISEWERGQIIFLNGGREQTLKM